MNIKLMVLLCSAGILAFGCSKSHKPDSITLQGTWNGQEVGANTPGSPSLVIEGAKFDFHGANTNEWYKATFSLREDTNPKQIEIVVTDCAFAKYVGTTARGIYKNENGKLTLTANEPGNPAAPADFDARGAREFVFTQK